jgi:protein-disulfide isomerase
VKKWDVILTVVLVACALLTTGLVVRRELFNSADANVPPAAKPVFVADWRAHSQVGATLGPPNAPVQIIEFADFECPFCASFHSTIELVQEQYPDKIAVSFVHFPLQGHRFAVPAARVAECAGEQGRFEAMHDVLFTNQRAFGLKPWSELAHEAGVDDLAAFDACAERETVPQRILDGQAAGERLDVKATPTVIINGWKLTRPPTAEQLERMVEAILAGKAPVG